MATETIAAIADPGLNVYAVVKRSDGYVLDFADYAFKNSSWTTPYAALTERATGDKSLYFGTINLSSLAPNLATVEAVVIAQQRLGGSPDLATDPVIAGPTQLVAQLGRVGPRRVEALVQLHHRTTGGGQTAQIHVALLVDGERAALASFAATATCEMAVVTHGGVSLFDVETSDFGNPTADHRFEFSFDDPNWSSDQIHYCDVTIVANGVTYVFPHVLMAWA